MRVRSWSHLNNRLFQNSAQYLRRSCGDACLSSARGPPDQAGEPIPDEGRGPPDQAGDPIPDEGRGRKSSRCTIGSSSISIVIIFLPTTHSVCRQGGGRTPKFGVSGTNRSRGRGSAWRATRCLGPRILGYVCCFPCGKK